MDATHALRGQILAAVNNPWNPQYTRKFCWVIPIFSGKPKIIIRVNAESQIDKMFDYVDIPEMAKWIAAQTLILSAVMPKEGR